MAEASLGIVVDSSKIEAATEALRNLAQAATDAKLALIDLGIVLTADLMVEEQPEATEIN